MRLLWIIFLIASGCATYDGETISLQWEFLDNGDGETKACLQQEDVEALRTKLLRCKHE